MSSKLSFIPVIPNYQYIKDEMQKGGMYSFIGPRRMKYMETAIKFRNKIEKERGIPDYNLKIVRVTKCNAATFKRIAKGELTEVNFESVWE